MNELNEKIIFLFGGGLIQGKNGKWRSSGPTDTGEMDEPAGGLLRVEAAAILAKRSPSIRIIVSGGRGAFSRIPDAPTVSSVVKQELVRRGISEARIVEESVSNNTFEQLCELERLAAAQSYRNIILLSNEHHLSRIKAMIKHAPGLVLLRDIPCEFLSAESVLLRESVVWQTIIGRMRASPFMKKRLNAEARGVRAIRAGTYDYKKKYA